MPRATFRFYEELNDFLGPERRKRAFEHGFEGRPAIKDTIEALGVPHTEIDLILVDGEPVGFAHRLLGGERVAVYPTFESIDIGSINRLRPHPLRVPRFVLDTHLGKLARLLRLLGFDTLWAADADDPELARLACEQERILLTRDRGLLKRSIVTRGYCPRSSDPAQQAREVVRRFDLAPAARPFTRCLRCNGTLEPASAASVREAVPPRVRQRTDRYCRCAACGRVYWEGSHTAALRQRVASLIADGS
jgi:hypothetical protein